MRLQYIVHAGQGPHLLLVHGFLTGPEQWLANLEGLSAVCTPVTVSLWGHAGASSPPGTDAYHPDSYVAQFDALRRDLGADRWFLLGYSLGAGLTIRYALAHPGQVLGHAFTNSTSALADASQAQRWQDEAEDAAARIESGGLAAMERIAVHPRHARRLPPPIYDALCRAASRHDPAGIANTLRTTTPNASVRSRLEDNVPPALLLCGNRERRFQPHRACAEATMANLEIAELDAGHAMNMEAPEAFNAALMAFLRSCPTS